jgi:hypothetical protein
MTQRRLACACSGRAMRLMGPKGRFRLQLINRIARAGKRFDDDSVSPVMRQASACGPCTIMPFHCRKCDSP